MCLNFNVVFNTLKDLEFRILIGTSVWNKAFDFVLVKYVKLLILMISNILLYLVLFEIEIIKVYIHI